MDEKLVEAITKLLASMEDSSRVAPSRVGVSCNVVEDLAAVGTISREDAEKVGGKLYRFLLENGHTDEHVDVRIHDVVALISADIMHAMQAEAERMQNVLKETVVNTIMRVVDGPTEAL